MNPICKIDKLFLLVLKMCMEHKLLSEATRCLELTVTLQGTVYRLYYTFAGSNDVAWTARAAALPSPIYLPQGASSQLLLKKSILTREREREREKTFIEGHKKAAAVAGGGDDLSLLFCWGRGCLPVPVCQNTQPLASEIPVSFCNCTIAY